MMDPKDGERRGAARPGPGPLSRQGSIYSLTFDEFQNTLGGMGGRARQGLRLHEHG